MGIVAVLVLIMAALLAVSGAFGARASAAQDCDENAIIFCGFSSPSDFISKVQVANDGHGHADLQSVYAAYGLTPDMYGQFVASSRQGTAFKDGRIVVDGQVVGTGGRTIGRIASFQGAGFFSQNINNVTYFGNSTQQAFAADSIPITVLFNAQGQMQFAVLNSCGNPESAAKVAPSFACNALNKAAVSGQANTFTFTTSASATTNASIAKLVYDFGDGSAPVTTSSPSAPVTHTFARSGTFTAKVTVFVHLPGNQTVAVPSVHCQTVITVTPPPTPVVPVVSCLQLTAIVNDQNKMSVTFTATPAGTSGNARLVSGDFNFGDGNVQTNVGVNDVNTITTTHTYTAANNFTASAVLHFSVNGQQQLATSAACMAAVTTAAPPAPPSQPTALPNTGAGDVIGIVAGTTALGTAGYRLHLRRRVNRS
jgi:hypothetical protein